MSNTNAFMVSESMDTSFILESVKKASKNPKEIFQEKHGMHPDKKAFLLSITLPLYEEYNAKLLEDILPGIDDMGIQVVIRANASRHFKDEIISYIQENKGTWSVVSEEEYMDIYQVADANLIFDNGDKALEILKNSLSHGVVPIAPRCFSPEFLDEYNPNLESGNSFLYEHNSPWALYAALVRAFEVYRFPYDWKNIRKSAIDSLK